MSIRIDAAAGGVPAVRDDGVFQGYASLFGTADGSGDVVMPGAFRDSIARRGAAGIRMLFQHDPAEPIGIWTELREDNRGLFVRGQLTQSVQRADELRGLLAEGAIDGLSIGFKTLLASRDRATGYRRLIRVDLWEISIVTFPMLAGARVKALDRAPVARRLNKHSRDGPERPGLADAARLRAMAARMRAGARTFKSFTSQGAKG